MTKFRIKAIIVIILAILIGYFVYSSEVTSDSDKKFKLGLDLAGGTHLTYRADTSEINALEINNSMDALRQTIERRINIFGVSEPIVQVEKGGSFSDSENQNRLIVELPGVTDVSEAIKQIGQTPILEFRLAKNEEIGLFDDAWQATTTAEILAEIYDMYESTGLTGAQLERATLIFDNTTGQPNISLQYNSEGKDLLADITGENVGQVMAIFLDGQLISNPVIQSSITNGQAVINGTFTPEEARELVRDLNFGALPVPIELIETQTIGPSLGSDTLESGIRALLVGMSIIFLFMIIWYRLPGLIASISLTIYVVIMLALFKFIPVTLTSSGLAGFILSIGMAVDANILIFERIKEELNKKANLYDAIKEGSAKAWTSIRDGNITSIISAVVLYWLSGTSLVKGFALVFGIGVLVSMLTAVVVSRLFLLALSTKKRTKLYDKLFMCGFFNKGRENLQEVEVIENPNLKGYQNSNNKRK
jgi:preprotein translocase subunit SecD